MEDVSPDDWFYRYVVHGLRFGLIEWVKDEGFVFELNRSVTRVEFITMFGRLHEYGNETIGTPEVGVFYKRYLAWAAELGLMHGNEHGDFMLYSYLTREQMAVIIYRYIDLLKSWDYFLFDEGVIAALFRDNNL